MSFLTTLLTIFLCALSWLFFSILFMVHIRVEAKKKWNKNVNSYSYFSYPIYKKIFLLGLKGALNPIVVVVSFILNLSIIILIALGIWNLISPNIYVLYALRVVVGIYGISFFLRLGCFLAFPLKL